jgi:hypothetical protein
MLAVLERGLDNEKYNDNSDEAETDDKYNNDADDYYDKNGI